jgi:hypothetical protein
MSTSAAPAPAAPTAPKVHPLLIGSAYGAIAAVIQVVVIQVNHGALKSNGLIGFVGTVIVPLIGLYLSGHYAGRHQRLNILKTNELSGIRSVFAGTGAGLGSGVIYVLVTELASAFLNSHLPYNPSSSAALGSVGQALGNVFGFIVWLILGLLLGSIGGVFGDSRAHKQLKTAGK